MPDLRGKVALITGASAGIGESTAKHFASLGCWLSLTGRNTANLERVAEACCAQGLPRDKATLSYLAHFVLHHVYFLSTLLPNSFQVLVVPGGIAVPKDVADVVQKTAKHFGKIDILVNNAGIAARGSVQSASVEDFKRSWQTNFLGPLCMIKNAVPYLRQAKGSIVNISSIASLITVSEKSNIITTLRWSTFMHLVPFVPRYYSFKQHCHPWRRLLPPSLKRTADLGGSRRCSA
nr:uncharacterized protein LOC126525259 [Dermacentor andersoni]